MDSLAILQFLKTVVFPWLEMGPIIAAQNEMRPNPELKDSVIASFGGFHLMLETYKKEDNCSMSLTSAVFFLHLGHQPRLKTLFCNHLIQTSQSMNILKFILLFILTPSES